MNDAELKQIADTDLGLTALRQAARKVVEEAKRKGGSVVVWQDGQVKEIPADQLPDPASLDDDVAR
jgi:predicted ATPase